MNLKLVAVIITYILYYQFRNSDAETMTFINMEHPILAWYDSNYLKNYSITCKRISRRDPRHYVNIYVHTSATLDNQIGIDMYFYQFLTNRYQPSFVEMHFKLCDMIQKDVLFGPALRRELGNRTCPFPPGEYDMRKMLIPFVPKGFPFVKGRIYCNGTHERGGVKHQIFYGTIDMEIKVAKMNKNKTKM